MWYLFGTKDYFSIIHSSALTEQEKQGHFMVVENLPEENVPEGYISRLIIDEENKLKYIYEKNERYE
jgi:hypothetical protein